MMCWKQIGLWAFIILYIPAAIAQSPVGRWVTFDDRTGKKRAVVMLEVSEGIMSGTIERVFKQPGDTGLCSRCSGKFKRKPVVGLRFLWGLQDKGQGVWSSGEILDPKTGKIYNARLTQKGDKLYVRGYVGLSILGKTQIWRRFDKDV